MCLSTTGFIYRRNFLAYFLKITSSPELPSLVWHTFSWTIIYYCLGAGWNLIFSLRVFLAALKTHWWPLTFFYLWSCSCLFDRFPVSILDSNLFRNFDCNHFILLFSKFNLVNTIIYIQNCVFVRTYKYCAVCSQFRLAASDTFQGMTIFFDKVFF